VGWHRAATPRSCWAGGIYPVALPADKISRAWLKLDEAIASFPIPLVAGSRVVELGAAPGGACQRLLEEGLDVVGIDPALVDERLSARPRFEQWRMRARDVRLKQFRGFDWVVSDMNIDPKSALESIGRVVAAPGAGPIARMRRCAITIAIAPAGPTSSCCTCASTIGAARSRRARNGIAAPCARSRPRIGRRPSTTPA
jgi:hypothetical protein